MAYAKRIAWNQATGRMEVVCEYAADYWNDEVRRPAAPAGLLIGVATLAGVSTPAAAAETASIYQQASDLERAGLDGSGVKLFHYDTGINPLSLTDGDAAAALGEPDMIDYRDNILRVDGQYVGLYSKVENGATIDNQMYYRPLNGGGHGAWMSWSLLHVVPEATLLTGNGSSVADWWNAFAIASDPDGFGAKTMSASYFIWYPSDEASDGTIDNVRPAWQEAWDTIKAHDGLVFMAAGNSGSNSSTVVQPFFYGTVPLVDAKYYGNFVVVTASTSGNDVGNFSWGRQDCGQTMYWCLAAPEGTLQRAADGSIMRNASGHWLYSLAAGTSWSAPNANAITALVAERYPWMSARNLMEVVLGTATDMSTTDHSTNAALLAGINAYSGWGEINPDAAIGGYGQFAWGQSKLDIPQGQTAYFDNDIGDDRADDVTTGIYNNDVATLGTASTTLAGGFDKSGAGTLVLNGNNTYHGAGNVLAGTVVVNGSNDNAAFVVAPGATLQAGDSAQRMSVGSLDNAGTLALPHADVTFDVLGDYAGRDLSAMLVQAYLADVEDTHSALLHIGGDSSGTTQVSVANAGGPGGLIAATEAQPWGHELIEVDGRSDAEFVQAGRIVAGAYDYRLHRGGSDSNDTAYRNWYLSSSLSDSDDNDNDNDQPVVEPVPGKPDSPVPGATDVQMMRPEAAIYLATAVAARAMFEADRPGRVSGEVALSETSYADDQYAWVNMRGNEHHFDVADGQASVSGQWQAIQLGTGGRIGNHWVIGFKAGRGSYDVSARSSSTGYRAKGDSKGSMAGAYLDFRRSLDSPAGATLSLDIATARMRHRIQGDGLEPERYKSTDWSASLQTAYGVAFGEAGRALVLRPSAGVEWTHAGTATHQEANGTRVDFSDTAPLQGTLGVDVLAEWRHGEQMRFAPYVGVQEVLQHGSAEVAMDQQTAEWDGRSRMLRMRAGVQARLSRNLHLELGVQHERGRDGYRANTFKAELAANF